MFWKKSGRGSPEQEPTEARDNRPGPIQIERDAERPGTILRVAGELEKRGAEIVELFKEVETPRGRAVLPIHLLWQKQDFFVEIETRAWKSSNVDKALDTAAALRGSEYAEAGLGLLSAYPVPEEVNFFFGRSPAALLQLDLYAGRHESPEDRADLFIESAQRHWDAMLGYELDCLPLTEKLLTNSLRESAGSDPDTAQAPPVLGSLGGSLGCYVGEVIRRNAGTPGTWTQPETENEDVLLEMGDFVLDPVGNARAFLKNGAEDSVAYYADYVLRQLQEDSKTTESGV